MGNYNYQYRKYYQDLQNKNNKKITSPIYSSISFEDVYTGKVRRKDKKDFFSSNANLFIYQLVVVVFMIMAIFYFKYSPEQKDAYNSIKQVMNTNSYSITTEEIKSFNVNEIINKISNYIKANLNDKKAIF